MEQAVLLAARHYGLEPDQVAWKERKKRHGFLKVQRKVIVEVDPENPRRAEGDEPEAAPSGSPAPAQTPTPAPPSLATPVPEAPTPEVEVAESTPGRGERRGAPQPSRPAASAPEPPATGTRLVGLPERPRSVVERYPVADGAAALAAEKAIKLTLELLEMEARVDVRQGDGQLEIELVTDDKDRLLDDDGRVLGAIQHLLPRLVRGFIGESVVCRVDCDHFLQIHEERLRDMAQRLAEEVKREGRPRDLKPMPPEERRIVHLALYDDSAVETRSVGDGFFKRVRVTPV